jgi:hypothetical protein
MPRPMKQSPLARPGVTLKQAPVRQTGPGIKLNVYGVGKTGKTRLVASFPKPLLLIGTEDGTLSIADGREKGETLSRGSVVYALTRGGEAAGVDFCHVSCTDDVMELTERARNYATVGVDHGGGLQNLVLKEFLNLDEAPLQKTWGLIKQKDWGPVNAQTKEHLAKLLVLSKLGINVCIIAHERSFGKEEEVDDNDLVPPKIGAALTPGVAGWLNGECDYVCQTHIRAQTADTSVKMPDGTLLPKRSRTGRMEYCLRVGPHPVYMTGFRHLGGELPECIVNPSYDKIIALIRGGPVE